MQEQKIKEWVANTKKGEIVEKCNKIFINDMGKLPEEIQVQQTESIKLIKNTKGYNWEIRILEAKVDRLEFLNNQMLTKFGSKEKE